MLSPTENSRIQGLFKASEWFSSTFQGIFNLQGLFQASPPNSSTFQACVNTAPLFLSWKWPLLFTYAALIQVHFRLDFFMESNNMNPAHTAPMEQSDPGPYCLQYRLPKYTSRRGRRWQLSWKGQHLNCQQKIKGSTKSLLLLSTTYTTAKFHYYHFPAIQNNCHLLAYLFTLFSS